MIKNILVLCFFCAFFSGITLCQEEIEIDSQVITVNPDKEYLIIKAGENEGVEIGDGIIVHKNGEKLAEAQIVEVRPDVAAAEILNLEKEIKEGDNVLIVKKAKKSPAIKENAVYQEPKRSKWATILGSKATVKSLAPVQTMANAETSNEALNPEKIQIMQESSVVKADIDTNLSTVFSYALMVLRENGYSVIFSDRATGNILATMPIELTLMKELWADATASIEHKLVVSLEMKNNNGATELNVASFKEHIQKGKQVKFPITNESKYYSLLVELSSKIKERAGH